MNHIKEIAAVAVKGRNFRHQLRPLTIIAGDNATGKTAITDAIQIALLGYLPALGKQPGKTMELAPVGAKQLEVQAEFTESGKVRRTFTRTRTGAGVDASGEAPAVLAAQLSFAEFLNAKPTERHTILSSLMGAIDYPALADRAKAELARLGLLELVTLTIDPQAEKPMEAAIESLADQARAIKQTVDQNRKTLASMAMVPEPAKVSTDQMTSAEANLQAANEAVGKATAVLDELNDRLQRAPDEPQEKQPTATEIEEAQSALVEAVEALREAKAQAKDRTDLTLQIEEAENRRRRLAPQASNPPTSAPTVTREEINLQAVQADRAIKDNTESHVKLNLEMGAATAKVLMTAKQLDQLKTGTCPCCGNAGAGLEAAMEAMKARQIEAAERLAPIEQRIGEIQSEIAANKNTIKHSQETIRQIDAWRANNEITTLDATIAKLKAKITTTTTVASATFDRDRSETRLRDIQTTAQAWSDYNKAAGSIPTSEAVLAARNALKDAIGARDSINTALGQLRRTNADHDAWLADQNRAAILQDETQSTEKASKGIGELRTFLQQAQRDAVAESMKPLILTAGIFMQGLVAGQMATEAHRVGILRGEAFLPLEVLSGMEMIAVSTACQAALASQSEIRILIVDELARMTPANRKTFVGNCKAAIEAGVVDQILVIDQTDSGSGEYTILV